MGKLKSEIGHHNVLIESTTFTESKNGTPGILFSVALTSDASDKGFVTLWLSEKAKARTLDTLKALGWDAAENDYDFNLMEFENPLRGKAAEVETQSEFYNGKDTVRIAFLNAPGSRPAPKTLTPERRAELAASVRASMGLPPKPRPSVGSNFPNDEVPF